MTIVLDDRLFGITEAGMSFTTLKNTVRTSSGILRFTTNTSSTRVLQATLTAINREQRDYLRANIQAAYYNNDLIDIGIPPEIINYNQVNIGSSNERDNTLTSTQSLAVSSLRSVTPAGSNVLNVRVDGRSLTPPATYSARTRVTSIVSANRLEFTFPNAIIASEAARAIITDSTVRTGQAANTPNTTVFGGDSTLPATTTAGGVVALIVNGSPITVSPSGTGSGTRTLTVSFVNVGGDDRVRIALNDIDGNDNAVTIAESSTIPDTGTLSTDGENVPPTDRQMFQGMQFQVGSGSVIHTVNSYFPLDSVDRRAGDAVVYPFLTRPVSSGTLLRFRTNYKQANAVTQNSLRFRGYITNQDAINEAFRVGAIDFLRIPVVIEEYRE